MGQVAPFVAPGRSGEQFLDAVSDELSTLGSNGAVRGGGAIDCVIEVGLGPEVDQLPLDLGTDCRRSGLDLLDQLRAAVDQRQHVMDVEASQEISSATALPGAELGRHQQYRRRGSDLGTRVESDRRRGRDRFLIPGVGEAEDVGVGRHYVEDQARLG